MFPQEINLYRSFEEPEPPFSYLNWHRMILMNVIFTAMMILISMYSFFQIRSLEKQRTALQYQMQKKEQTFFNIKKKYPAIFFSKDANLSVEKLTEEMHMRENILKKVANQKLFSTGLEELGRSIVPQVWLTEIIFNKNGDEVTLKGKSASAEKLEQFLTNLTTSDPYKDYSLTVKNIQDNTPSSSVGDLLFDIILIKSVK